MANYLRMPGVSADADEAVLEQWVVAVGDQITSGQTVGTVETEKAVVDLTSDLDGKVYRLLCEDGASVPVGDPIAIILEDGDDDSAGAELEAKLGGSAAPVAVEAVAETQPDAAPESDSVAPAAAAVEAKAGRIFATPLVRRLAKEHGVDLVTLTGSGANGRIIRKDLEAALAARQAAPAPAAPVAQPSAEPGVAPRGYSGEFVPHSRVRKATASRLQQSKQVAPHFYVQASVEVDNLLELRAKLNTVSPVRISVNDLVVKAAAVALAEVPEMNVLWTDEGSYELDTVDIAVAVATERGLLTPVIRNVDQLSLSNLSTQIRDAAGRAGEGKLRQDELEGGSMTVTNMGMFDVDDFAAIINPPQTSILAVSSARDSVVVRDGAVAIAKVMKMTLSADHRPVDGVTGAKYMSRIREILENPLLLTV